MQMTIIIEQFVNSLIASSCVGGELKFNCCLAGADGWGEKSYRKYPTI